MEISIDREKTFDKTWHPFMIETLDKLGVEGIFLTLIYSAFVKNPQLISYLMVKD